MVAHRRERACFAPGCEVEFRRPPGGHTPGRSQFRRWIIVRAAAIWPRLLVGASVPPGRASPIHGDRRRPATAGGCRVADPDRAPPSCGSAERDAAAGLRRMSGRLADLVALTG